ncbi:MAG: Fic/DOC family protein [Hyphomicrobiaceae bacterium]
MYRDEPDPYTYPGSTVLKNKFNITSQADLEAFETVITDQRSAEGLPSGRFSLTHYRAIHRHLFQDVYDWAGKFRTVRIAKGRSVFCYPEHIETEMRRIFGRLAAERHLRDLPPERLAERIARYLTEINAVHPFREGNGRTQLVFFSFPAERAGHPFDLSRLDPAQVLAAMIAGFQGNERPLADAIGSLISAREAP